MLTDDTALCWLLYERANARSRFDYQYRTGQVKLRTEDRRSEREKAIRAQKAAALQQK